MSNKLSNAKIKQLLAVVGSAPKSNAEESVDAVDYDWQRPRFFNLEQLAELERFARKVANKCVGEFSRIYQSDINVSVLSAAPCFWQQSDTDDQQSHYYIAVGVDPQEPFGLMSIPNSSASSWTGQVLGETQSTEESGQKLSKLEESILLDIASGFIKTFARVYGSDLQFGSIEKDRSLIMLEDSDELFKITIEAKKTDSDDSATQLSFWVRCDKLQALAGKNAAEEAKKTPTGDAGLMQKYVHNMPLPLSVQLARTTLTFEEVMDLQVDDILVLDKMVTDTVKILINNQVFFDGLPAQSGGKHAVVIV